jgi:hypothetical protein
MMPDSKDETATSFDREKWEVERNFRERELVVKEGELELHCKDQASSGWRNPLVVAILAATAAAAGNAVVAVVNGRLQRDLEAQKSEQTRILEMIKTGDPDKAADNLDFLLKTGLIDDSDRAQKIQHFLDSRTPGSGPSLPTASGSVSSEIKPGVQRWSVRTGADADAALVGDKIVPITIRELAAFPPPDSRDPRFQEHRFKPVETTLYRVEGTLTAYKEEMSGDYHLILTDESGETMIAAAPNPDPAFVAPSSRWAKEIAAVHKAIKDRLNPTSRFEQVHVKVRVTGLGYFSYPHGVRGEAKNAVQLHPVTSIEFL